MSERIRLLVLHGKHVDDYYLIRSEAQLHATALQVLKQRVKEGWIFENSEDPLWPGVKQAIEDDDGPLAFKMMLARRGTYEYENFEVETPEEITCD